MMVGHRTMGRSLSTGRGARAAALDRRASLRLDLEPGYTRKSEKKMVPSKIPLVLMTKTLAGGFARRKFVPGRSECAPDAASPFGDLLSSQSVAHSVRGGVGDLTVADELLVVLDRLHNRKKSTISSKIPLRLGGFHGVVVPLCRSAISHSERVLVMMVSWAERSRIIGGVRFEVGPPCKIFGGHKTLWVRTEFSSGPRPASAWAQRNPPKVGFQIP